MEIPFRPLHAMGRLAKHFAIPISAESPLADSVQAWFRSRYGDRLKAPTLLGRLPVLIRGDVYVLRLAPHVERIPGTSQVRPILRWDLDAGDGFFDSLTDVEKSAVNDLLEMGWLCFSELAPHVCERVLSPASTFDLDVAVDELVRSSGARPGLSKWASLQSVEKTLKEFVRLHDGEPPHIHDLTKLHSLSVSHGLPSLMGLALPEGPLLSLVNCSPGVRYDQPVVTVQEAVAASHAAVLICFAVAARLRQEAGGRCWLHLTKGSPARFVARRIVELAGIDHQIDHEASN